MKRLLSYLISLFLLFLFLSCGKKGPILPPLVKIPKSTEDVKVTQRGAKVILTWSNPTAYIDGRPLTEITEVEIWLLEEKIESEEKEQTFSKEEFERNAKLASSIKKEKFPDHQIKEGETFHKLCYFYELSGEEFETKKLTFGLRIKIGRKKKSAFSELVSIEPKILPAPPQKVRASVFKDRIEIEWDPPEKNFDLSSPPDFKGYNIYRAEGEGEARRINSQLVEKEKYDDKIFVFGSVYYYSIRASVTESSPFLESEDSEIKKISAKDTFAPASVAGLVSVAGKDVIALSWDASKEEDLAGYQVWRKAEGEDEFVLLTFEPIRENSYSDITVERNTRYYYAITAVDEFGNESQKSEIVSDVIRKVLYENLSL